MREAPTDGRLRGDPPELALGIGVAVGDASLCERALTGAGVGDLVLAVARLASEAPWAVFFVLARSQLTRVALSDDRREARVFSVAYEHIRAGLLDVTLIDDRRVRLGTLESPSDERLILAAMWNSTLPPLALGYRPATVSARVSLGSERAPGDGVQETQVGQAGHRLNS